MAPKRAIKKTVPAIRKTVPKPRTSAKKLPIKKPHLTKDQASHLRNCFKPDGDIDQSLRSELAAEWYQGTKLTKEKMQEKITRWVYRQRHIQKRRNVELGVAIENTYVRFTETETRCLVSYFELYGDIDAGLRRELAKAWSPGTKFTEDKMFRRVSDWRKAHKKKLKAHEDKNKECGMKDEEREQKKGKNEKRQPMKEEKKVIEANEFEKHRSNGTLLNVLQLDELSPRDEEELLKLYREAKIVTLEKIMEWSSEINKSVHTVLSWIMRKREEVLDDSEVDMKQSGADETNLLDVSEMDDGNHQEVGEMDQVKADGGDEGVQDDEDVKKDDPVEKGNSDVIEIGDDDKDVIVIDDGDDENEDDDDRSEDDFYLGYLPLENDNHTQCFINTIANILYSCEGVRDFVNNNANSKHRLCRIISDIFTGKTCSTQKWRNTLKKSYHKGQQDVAEVFSYLVNNLNEEIKLDLMACTETISTKCKACGATKREPSISNELHSSLSISRHDTFESFYDEKYGAKRREDCGCGGMREKRTTLKTHGKYHFMITYHEKMRFKSLDADQEFEMFDSKWRIRSFAEYFPAEEEETVGTTEKGKQRRVKQLGRNGHYVAWVKADDQWLRVNDNQVDQVENHLDLSEHFVNLIAFEKIEY
ncbi:hypothetical protein CAEBREN_25729 [Caenorhabditis brenneri]|uniref:USP domain-containing protein n=1 Tax=Caenorhabditis brenneri TaxID=135651 RepID=G0P5Q8_CAEBE|nr:hypothetical protein CAEBREN_25729 [Caenorhabditis brenneri]